MWYRFENYFRFRQANQNITTAANTPSVMDVSSQLM
jgi:hypothetical protein